MKLTRSTLLQALTWGTLCLTGLAHANGYQYAMPGNGFVTFKSPSGNIICRVTDPEQDYKVLCEINARHGASVLPEHQNCPRPTWGSRLYLDAKGAGVECDAPSILSEKAIVVPYGESVSSHHGQWQCHSQETGMRCVNRQGKGFELSRSKQRLF